MLFENWVRKEQIIVKKLFEKQHPKETNCDDLISPADAEEAVRIVEALLAMNAWAEAHQAKTRQDALLKMFPNSQLDKNGALNVCPARFDANYRGESPNECGDLRRDCHDCRKEYWLEEVE